MFDLFRRFTILVWKNIIYWKRNFIVNMVEFIIPLIFFAFILVIHNELHKELHHRGKGSQISNINNTTGGTKTVLHDYQDSKLLYTPDTPFTKIIMERIAKTNSNGLLNVVPFTSEEKMEKYFVKNKTEKYYGIVFKSEENSTDFYYKIRNKVSPLIDMQYLSYDNLFVQKAIYDGGFLALQLALDMAYIQHVTGESPPYEVIAQTFSEDEQNVIEASSGPIQALYFVVVPFLIPFSFIILCPSLIKKMVEEKQTGIKELLKMVGLKTWMVWTGWMINTLAIYFFCCVCATIVLCVKVIKTGPMFPYTHWSIVFILFLLFSAACVTFSFVISACFYKPTIAVLVGVVLWVLLLNSLMPLQPKSLTPKLLACMVPTMSIVWSVRIMTIFHTKKEMLTWTNLFSDGRDTNDISMGLIFITLLFSIVIYTAIASYLEAIIPGPFGRPKPWYFVFQMCYKYKKKDSIIIIGTKDNIKLEDPPIGHKVGISICNLQKTFAPNFIAVNNINLDIYEGQITALLGHNGAGKTTTMSIITGMISPSSGAIFYQGMNIFENMEKFQKNVGLCPQHNLLFSHLTVIEHLIFFGMIKGLSLNKAKKEGLRVLNIMNIENEKSAMVAQMSGGMKRKICLAIALLGNPQVLILDEPTSGMDPESRRELWNFLLSLRNKHTILITTHFMEEADVLGDRIAIMDHGQVYCCGSTLFLKKLYGTGYKLTLGMSRKVNVNNITSFIQSFITGAQLKSTTRYDAIYTLPQERTSTFPELFHNLELSKYSLGIESVSISCTTMEDVFLKVGEINASAVEEEPQPDNNPSQVRFSKRSRGIPLVYRQSVQLLYKKFVYTWRNWFGVLLFLIIITLVMVMAYLKLTQKYKMLFPMIMLVVLLTTTKTARIETQSPIPIHLSTYNYFSPNTYVGVKENGQKLANIYEALIQKEGSIVTYVAPWMMKELGKTVIVGGEFGSTCAKALFSNRATHAPPIALNLITQTILQSKNATSNNTISVISHPFVEKGACHASIIKSATLEISIKWLLGMPIGILVLVSHFIQFPLTERVCNIKQIQYMAGVSPIIYWLTCFILDYILYVVLGTLIMVGLILATDPLNMFTNYKAVGLFSLITFLFGLSGGMYAYFYSYFANTAHYSMFTFIAINLLLGAIPSAIIYVLKVLDIIGNSLTSRLLGHFLSLNPYYAMCNAFGYFAKITALLKYCHECPDVLPDCYGLDYYSYKQEGTSLYMTYLLCDWLLYLSLILLIDYGHVNLIYNYIKVKWIGKHCKENDIGDEDIQNEKLNTKSSITARDSADSTVLTVSNLVKKFSRKVTAVNGVSFKTAAGECFGLLGTTGAGKTTTFRMLTGDILPTDGDAQILNVNLSNNRGKFLPEIGYCPQVDSINDLLTGEELLRLVGVLRGIPSNIIQYEINECLKLLGLVEYRHRQCGHYSGGNKRKICTGMALIGNPRVILLDEPTSGVDPASRRRLWKVLVQCKISGQSIVLTSHSMEECEELCTRLTILLKGQMKCIGSPQHLKMKYGLGYTIMIKLFHQPDIESAVQELKNDIDKHFSSKCSIIEESLNIINYHVVDTKLPLSVIFRTMEKINQKNNIVEEYFVSDTTLEQVFLALAKH